MEITVSNDLTIARVGTALRVERDPAWAGGSWSYPGFFTRGRASLVAVVCDGTTLRVLGAGPSETMVGSVTLTSASQVFVGGRAYSDPAFSGTPGAMCGLLAQVCILPYALTEDRYRALLGAVMESDDLACAPVTEILQLAVNAAGLTDTVQALGHDRYMIAPDIGGQSAAAVGDALAAAAGAMFVCDRATGAPTWIDHRYVGGVVTIPIEDIAIDALAWESDRSLRVTDVTSDGRTLASSGATPKAGRDLTPLMPADTIQGYANWLANTGAVMGKPRLSTIKVELRTCDDAGRVADYLDIDLRSRVRVTSPPSQIPSPLRTMTVEGYEEVVSLTEWTLTLNTAPDPRGIYGDAVQGIAGATADNRYGY